MRETSSKSSLAIYIDTTIESEEHTEKRVAEVMNMSKMFVELHRSVPLRQNCHVLMRELKENDMTTIRRALQGRPPSKTCSKVTEIKMKILARENKI